MTKLYGSLEQHLLKQSIKPSSSSQNSTILQDLPLVHLVQSISIKTQKLTDLSQQLQNLTGQMSTCLVLFVAL